MPVLPVVVFVGKAVICTMAALWATDKTLEIRERLRRRKAAKKRLQETKTKKEQPVRKEFIPEMEKVNG